MALVSKKLYTSWYEEDTFIRRNFLYIFKNPLWNKGIPEGFILCPMFWMSLLVGFLFLRCFLVPLFLVLGFITRKTIVKLDARYTKWFNSHLEGTAYEDVEFPQCGMLLASLGLGLGIPTVLYLVSLLLSELAVKIHDSSNPYLFWWALFGLPLSIGCLIYYQNNQYDSERCRTSKYVGSWMGIFLIMVCIVKRADLWVLIKNICQWVVFHAGILWESLCETACEFASIAWYGVTWFFATGDPLGFTFPPIAVLISFGLFMYIVSKLVPDEIYTDPEFASEQELWGVVMMDHRRRVGRHRDDAIMGLTFVSVTMENDMREELEKCNVLYMFRRECTERYIRQHWTLATLFGKGRIPYSRYKGLKKDAAKGRANFIVDPSSCFQYYMAEYYGSEEWTEGKRKMKEIIKETYADFETIIGKGKGKTKAKAKSAELCKMCTNIAIFPFKMVWAAVKAVALFVAAVAQYTWDVAKAKKQGWCPYVTFKNIDTTDK